jgi:hypothetical protein
MTPDLQENKVERARDFVLALAAALVRDEAEGEPLGFGPPPQGAEDLVTIGGNGSTLWHRYDHEEERQVPIKRDTLRGYLQSVEAVTFSNSDYGDAHKLRVRLDAGAAGAVTLQTGLTTTFADYFLAGVLKRAEEGGDITSELMTLTVETGNTDKVTLPSVRFGEPPSLVVTDQSDKREDPEDAVRELAVLLDQYPNEAVSGYTG